MISDKERAVLELARKNFDWSEIPGSDYLRDLITEADKGGSEGGRDTSLYVWLSAWAHGCTDAGIRP